MAERRHMWPRLFKTSILVFLFVLSIFQASSFAITPIYVDPVSGDDTHDGSTMLLAKQTILNALSSIDAGGTIYLGNGIYKGDGNTGSPSGLGWPATKNISLIAQTTGLATVDGENSRQFLNILSNDVITIEGLTIKNCHANQGGAIYVQNGNVIITLKNILGIQCTSDSYAGFYRAGNNGITAEAINSTFINCQGQSGGVFFLQGSTLNARGCIFKNNQARGNFAGSGGGAIFAWTAKVHLNYCTFEGNTAYQGGAISGHTTFTARPFITATNCTFNNNAATNNAGAIHYSYGSFDNCIFTKNTSTGWTGGGVFYSSYVTVMNSVFAYNSAARYAVISGESFTATNCVFAKNSHTNTPYPLIDYVSPLLLDHCNVQADMFMPGTGNVSTDAYFVTSNESNVQFMSPAPGSGAIDTGTDASPVTLTDMTGYTRPRGYGVDLGPLEFRGPSVKLLYPDGGESVIGGQALNIQWQSMSPAGFSGNPVILRYSTNNGINWTQIPGAFPSTGSYSWTTPNVASNTCKISVEVTDNGAAGVNWNCDTSDSSFLITSNIIYVSPSGSDSGGNGTITTPYKTIGKAMSLIPANGEVRMMTGRYSNETFPIRWPSKDFVTLKASEGATGLATIDGNAGNFQAISIETAVNMTIEGIDIMEFKPVDKAGGAAICGSFLSGVPQNTHMWLNNVQILWCTSEGTGANTVLAGGIYCISNLTYINATGCKFIGNKAVYAGFAHAGTWNVVDCLFQGNKSSYTGAFDVGGGVATRGIWYARNCTFDANTASNVGGAFDNPSTLVATNCVFSRNIALYGGAIGRSPTDIGGSFNCSVYDCLFTKNGANAYGGVVGSITPYSDTFTASGCVFSSNEAYYGGAVSKYGLWLAKNSAFRNNRLNYMDLTNPNGGGVTMLATWFAEGCRFENNFSQVRGGVFYRCTASVTNCVFNYNIVSDNGGVAQGGVIMNDPERAPFMADNCVFIGNASYNGGIVSYAPHMMRNCIFLKNSSIAFQGNSVGTKNLYYNCAFQTTYGTLVYNSVGSTTVATYENCAIWNNAAPIFYGGTVLGNIKYCDMMPAYFVAGAGNVSFEPNFRSILESDITTEKFFRPAAGSRLIDSGTIDAIASIDAAGRIRPKSWSTDIGPYEFQGPTVKLTYPNGGVTYDAETALTITWQTTNDSSLYNTGDCFTVSYSLNGGGSWIVIPGADHLPWSSTGSYPWTTPLNGSTQALVSVEVRGNTSIPTAERWNCDRSDTTFSIRPKILYVALNGHDNATGTIEAPLQHIYVALNLISAGGTIYVKPGTYVFPDYSGGDNYNDIFWPQKNDISLKALTKGTVILDGQHAPRRLIDVKNSYNLTIEGLSLVGGGIVSVALPGGGAIYLEGNNTLRMKDVTIDSNTTEVDGGAIVGATNQNSVTIEATNCIFTNNMAKRYGGVARYTTWKVKNCYFGMNASKASISITGFGGGVFSDSVVSAETCTFETNSAPTANGGVSGGGVIGGTFFGRNCIFRNNSTTLYGGVLTELSGVTLESCTATNNSAGYGGVLYHCAKINLLNCSFTNNKATGAGGVASGSVGYNSVATNCSFIGNSAATGGGAIGYGHWNTNNCIFRNNSAASGNGGGVFYGASNFRWVTQNCTYDSNSSGAQGGVFSAGIVTATNCAFTNNVANLGGVVDYNDQDELFHNCSFVGNIATGANGYGGVFHQMNNVSNASTGHYVYLNNCIFGYNKATYGGITEAGFNIIANNCAFYRNSANHGGVYWAYNMTNKNCIIWGNLCTEDNPVWGNDTNFNATYSDIQPYGFKVGTGNISEEPFFLSTDQATMNLRINSFSPCVDTATFEGAPTLDADGQTRPFPPTSNKYYDMGAYEVHRRDYDLYVDALYGDDRNDGSGIDTSLKTIKAALGFVCSNRTIWVKDGTYNENQIKCWPTYWVDNVTIKSRLGDRKKVLVNASFDLSRVPPSLHGTIEGISIQNSPLAGVTFPVGTNFLAKNCVIQTNSGSIGGGISNGRAINCTINGNTATIRGGGACDTILSYCTLESNNSPSGGGAYNVLADHCWFKKNTGNLGGGVYGSTVSDCIFSNNNAVSGAGAYFSTVEGCSFSFNSASNLGGGLYGGKALECTFNQNSAADSGGGMFSVEEARKCIFFSNTSGSGGAGGGIFTNTPCTVENCLFANNTGYNFYKDNASVPASIINCTFYGSKPIYVYAGDVDMLNGIVWNGTIETAPGSTLNATYSDIMGGLAGTENINTNPSFVNPSASNYHLQQDSSCVNTGTFEGAPTEDLEGRLRADPDMGAYEWASATLFMTAPHGGEIMEIGSNFNVTWNGLDQSALPALFDNISIEVSTTEPAVWNNIDTVHLVETYSWPVPPVLSDHYKIALAVSGPGGAVTGRKESGYFSVVDTVAPVVTLESFPQYLGAGINVITWDATDLLPATDPVTIEVSTNEGATWTILGEGQPMTGDITYETPSDMNVDYPHCIIRVKVIDLAGNYTSEQTMFGVDTKAPTMELTIASSVTSRTVPFTLSAYDEHGISHRWVKSGDVSQWHDYPGTSELPATITLYPPTSGLHTVTFEVYDLGMNMTSETREIDLVLPATPEISSVRINNMDPATVQYLPNKIKINCSIFDYQSDLASIEIKVRVGTTTYTYYATPEMSAEDITYYTASREFTLPMTNGSPYIIIEAIDWAGNVSTYEAGTYTITTASGLVGSPRNVPNPFRPHHGEGTTIQYLLTTDTTIKVMVYDITNRLIWQRVFTAGSQGGKLNANNVFWDGRNDAGDYVPNGVYIYFITTGDKILGKGQMSVTD